MIFISSPAIYLQLNYYFSIQQYHIKSQVFYLSYLNIVTALSGGVTVASKIDSPPGVKIIKFKFGRKKI